MQRSIEENRTFSLRTDIGPIYYLLWRKAWFIGLVTAVAVLAGVIYLARSEKIYAAKITIEVEGDQQKSVKADVPRLDDRSRELLLKTIEQNLLSPALMLRLIHRQELANDPAFHSHAAQSESELEQILNGNISAKIIQGTSLIEITVEDTSPARAQKIATLVVDEFIRSTSESHVQVSQGAHEFLRKEADRLQAALTKSEEALQTYKVKHRAVALGEKENIVDAKLDELNRRVTDANANAHQAGSGLRADQEA